MFRSRNARYGCISVLLLGTANLPGCTDHKEATHEEIAQFKYCSGFTAAAERAAYQGLIDLETAGNLRAGQKEASDQLLLPAQEMDKGVSVMKADAQGNVQASTTTEVGRGLEEGHVMIDKNQRQELLDRTHTCSEFFAALVR